MHLGFALLTLFPGRVGGSETNVRGLLGEFASGNGPERVTVLANRQVADAYATRAGGPVALHEVSSYRSGNSAPTRLAAMLGAGLLPRRAARDVPSGLDVIHHPVTVPIPRIAGIPTVTTLFDVQHHDLPELFSRGERLFRRWAYDGAARRADAVITSSEHSKQRLIQATSVDAAKVHVVALGIDHERFVPEPTEADERLAERLPQRYVVYPGNLWPHKNHHRLVSALAEVEDRDLALVLCGQDYGRAGELLEHARRAGVEHRVHHLGFLEPDELPALMRRAQAMVFPSLYEGFGAPPLEAMACGCPVACSGSASLAEIVGDSAISIEDPRSIESIAAAIDRLVAGGQRIGTLRTSGFARAAGYTWSSAARSHADIYARVAATSG